MFFRALGTKSNVPSPSGGLDLIEIAQNMSGMTVAVAVVLFFMSFWSVGVSIERIYTYNQARKQSKLYAPRVAQYLREGRLDEAIRLSASKDYRYSHLARVVLAGLEEYQFQQKTGGASLSREDVLDTVRRSIQRATALTASDLKKGVSTLATIGSTAPFVGLLGTVVGAVTAFVGIRSTGSGGIGAVSAGIAEALIETALGLFVAIPTVWFYNWSRCKREVRQCNASSRSTQNTQHLSARPT
jgi:biopolymer transport protein ExbB/biopolymer transport protein TolQ